MYAGRNGIGARGDSREWWNDWCRPFRWYILISGRKTVRLLWSPSLCQSRRWGWWINCTCGWLLCVHGTSLQRHIRCHILRLNESDTTQDNNRVYSHYLISASASVLHLAIWTFAIFLLLFNAITLWILYLTHFFWWRLRPPCVLKASWQNLLLHAKGIHEDCTFSLALLRGSFQSTYNYGGANPNDEKRGMSINQQEVWPWAICEQSESHICWSEKFKRRMIRDEKLAWCQQSFTLKMAKYAVWLMVGLCMPPLLPNSKGHSAETSVSLFAEVLSSKIQPSF